MLTEMVRSEELLRVVTFPELVHSREVLSADIEIGWVGKLFAAVAADVDKARFLGRWVEGSLNSG